MTRRSSDDDAERAAQTVPPKTGAGDGVARFPLMLAPNGDILRENFTRERMEALREEMVQAGDTSFLTHDEREANRRAFLSRWDGRSDIWVFGYGSLMWNPAIHVTDTAPARLHGLHRAFCLNLVLGRGTHDNPGLMLGLDRGGSCRGMAHRIAADLVESETEILWMREMIGGAYRPAWVRLEAGGRRLDAPAFTFSIDRSAPRYVGRLPEETVVHRIARAEGRLGTNRAYLYRTVERLDALGVGDGPMHRLCAQVRRMAGD